MLSVAHAAFFSDPHVSRPSVPVPPLTFVFNVPHTILQITQGTVILTALAEISHIHHNVDWWVWVHLLLNCLAVSVINAYFC